MGREGLARNLRSSSSQRCSVGLRSGLCGGQSSSSTPNSSNRVFIVLALCTGAQSCWNRKGPSPNCCHKVRSIALFKMSWYAEALRLHFIGDKGPGPNPEKQPHTGVAKYFCPYSVHQYYLPWWSLTNRALDVMLRADDLCWC